MKKIFLVIFLLSFSCKSKDVTDPLLLPPNYNDIPDVNNPEKIEEKDKPQDIEKLKDLLLKSE